MVNASPLFTTLPLPPPDLELGLKPDDRITGVFLDPTASHLLVCYLNARDRTHETLYLAGEAVKPAALKKWRGVAVTAVAWNPCVRAWVDRSGSVALACCLLVVIQNQ